MALFVTVGVLVFLSLYKYVWQLQWALGKNVKHIIPYTFLGFDFSSFNPENKQPIL